MNTGFFKVPLFLATIIIVLLCFGYFYEKNNVTLETVDVEIDASGSNLANVKMIQLSDFHFMNAGIREDRVRNIVNGIHPDIIFLTGDLFDSVKEIESPGIVDNLIDFLKTMSYEKYFICVLGEDGFYYKDHLKRRLGDANIIVLDNEIHSLNVAGTRMNIIGITPGNSEIFDDFYDKNGKNYKDRVKHFTEFRKTRDLKEYENYYYYVGGEHSLEWENYEISGQMKLLPEHEKIGVAFYSQFPLGIFKSYFMEVDSEKKMLCVASTGTGDLRGNKCSVININDHDIYSYRIDVKHIDNMTLIRINVWVMDGEEPEQWQIECYDSGEKRSTKGTVGLSLMNKYSDEGILNIKVRMTDYRADSVTQREVFRETPLNMDKREMIIEKKLWMTLDDIEYFISKNVGKPYLLEQKLDEIIGNYNLDGFTILLSHTPRIIKVAGDREIDMVLSGSTHGGQIDLPFIDKYIHESFDGRLLKRGLNRFSGTYLYINRGIGTSLVPFRLNCSPEVTLFRMTGNH